MRKQINQVRQSVLPTIIAAILIFSAFGSTFAQGQDFKVGEKIEYSPNCNNTNWTEGIIFALYPQYNQVGVREKPTEYFPQGSETAKNIKCVRHIVARQVNDATKDTDNKGNTDQTQKTSSLTKPKTNNTNGKGLMTKEEIIGYMRANGYTGGQPKRDSQICKDLIEQIKQRGVVEPFKIGDDVSPIRENGCLNSSETDVEDAVKYNVGAPKTFDWLTGTWLMSIIGGTVDYAPGDGNIYRKNESIAKLGFITINADGTYIWKVEPSDLPTKYVKGKWRKATDEEMGLRGGAGLILKKADESADWIVFKYVNQYLKGDNIDVQHLQERGAKRRIGDRK